MATSGRVTVTGLTIMYKELFITTQKSMNLEVYDSTTYSFKRLLRVPKLNDPWDMCSCLQRCCLYIANGQISNEHLRFNIHVHSRIFIDENITSNNGKILRVDKAGNLQHSWKIGDDYGTLSITLEGNVILTVPVRGKIVEYDTNGGCLREIIISTDLNLKEISFSAKPAVSISTRIICPRQSEKLSTGNFVINYFICENYLNVPLQIWQRGDNYYYENQAGLCMTDEQGLVIKVFHGNGGTGFGELGEPWYFAVDKDQAVLVLERSNRICLLNPNLDFRRGLVSKEQGSSNFYKMCLDEANGRLLVSQSETTNDQVLVYEVKTL